MTTNQYIEGSLYVTQKQWEMLQEYIEISSENTCFNFTGIPVYCVKPGEQVKLPSGKVLVYSQIQHAFFIFNPGILDPKFQWKE